MLWRMMEMLNAAVTNPSDAVPLKKPPPCTAGSLFLAAKHSKFTSTPGSFEIFKNAKTEIMCKILTRSAERLLTLDAITRPYLAKSKVHIFTLTCRAVYPFRLFQRELLRFADIGKRDGMSTAMSLSRTYRGLLKTIHTPCCEQFIVGTCITVQKEASIHSWISCWLTKLTGQLMSQLS